MMHGTFFFAQITANSFSLLLIVRRESQGLTALSGTSANTSQRPLCQERGNTKVPQIPGRIFLQLDPNVYFCYVTIFLPEADLKHIICSAISKQSAHYQANYPALIACLINLILSIITI